MITTISLLWLSAALSLLYFFYQRIDSKLKQYFLPGILFKIFAGITLGLVYTYYYAVGDTFGFFEDAKILTQLFQSNPAEYFHFLVRGNNSFAISDAIANSQVRSLFLVKILSFFSLVSFNNYWAAGVYFSIISFLGSWYMVTKISKLFPEGKWAAVISFLFLPSFIFWSSGITKECLSAGALMFLCGLYIVTLKREKLKWWELIIGALCVYVLWNLKYYWIGLFIPAILSTLLLSKIPRIKSKVSPVGELIIWILVFCSIVLLASRLHPNFYFERFLEVIVDNNNAYTRLAGEGPFVHFYQLQPQWSSLLLNSPWALLSGLFRPFIFESRTIFQLWISIENTVLIILLIYNLRYMSQIWLSSDRLLLLSVFAYITCLAIFLTISTPNFGTLSRYRIGYLPILFFLLLYSPSQHIFARITKLK